MTQRKSASGTRRLSFWLLVAALVSVCVNLSWFQSADWRNNLLIATMCASPLVLLMKGTRVIIPRIDIPLLLLIVWVVSAPVIFHPDTLRWTTILFTVANCVFFMMTARLMRIAGMTAEEFLKVTGWIVIAYAAVLLIQQICVVAGMPVFNEGVVYILPFKLNSLSAEASHSVYTVGMLMYIYSQIWRARHASGSIIRCFRENPAVWLCFLWVMCTSCAVSAFFFAPLALLPFIDRKSWAPILGIGASLLLIVIVTVPISENYYFMRAQKIVFSVISLDEDRIIAQDESASDRIVPTIRGFKAVRNIDSSTLTGHGVDADRRDIEERPAYNRHYGSAGMFALWYNYGLPAALLLWFVIVEATLVPRKILTWFTTAFAIFMTMEYNLQLLWMVVIFSMGYKYIGCRRTRLLDTL